MTDAEYNQMKEQAHEILRLARSFDAWKFKHEAKLRGERTFGQWMWTIHLEAKEAP
jgi:hypothetical protein